MLTPLRLVVPAMIVAAGLCFALYSGLGTAKPFVEWNWMHIVSEGGTALMVAIWAIIVIGSHLGSRVTVLVATGLTGIALGTWANFMNEFFTPPPAQYWNNGLESVPTLAGMLLLTLGLYFWYQKPLSLAQRSRKRARSLSDCRTLDRIAQLADADYLLRQIRLELERNPEQPCALILLDINRFHLSNGEHGQKENHPLFEAISHIMLHTLREDDLLCRYAGDRFAILMPATSQETANQTANRLKQSVRALANQTRASGKPIDISVHIACTVTDELPETPKEDTPSAFDPAATAHQTASATV